MLTLLLLAVLQATPPAQNPPTATAPPNQATTEFQTAIEHLKAGRAAAAEPILLKLIKSNPNDADVNEGMGMLISMKGQPERALPYLEKAVRLKPSGMAWGNLGSAYGDLGRDDQAIFAFRKAVELEPANVAASYQLAGLYMKRGAFGEAAPLLDRVLKAKPAPEIRYLLALCYSATDRPAIARSVLLGMTVKDRDREEVQLLLGTAALALGRKAEAQGNFERVLKLNPDSVPGAANLGWMFVQAGATDRGLPMLEGAWKRDNTAYLAGYNLAQAYHHLGRLENARGVLATLLTKGESGDVFHLLGQVEAGLNDSKSAIDYLSRAVELDPREAHIFDLGYQLLQTWTLDRAAATFTEGVQKFPKSARLWMGLGSAYLAQSKNDEAVGAFLHAAEMGDDPRAYDFLGQAYLASKSAKPDVAARFHAYRAAHPQDASAAFYEGASIARSGDADAALPLLQRAIALDPKLAEAHFELGKLYAQKEQNDLALAEFQATVALNSKHPQAYRSLSQTYAKAGRESDAATALARHEEISKQEAANQQARLRGAIAALRNQ